MGLRVTYTDNETGATYDVAYVRVLSPSIRLDFDHQHAEFDALVFFNGAAAAAGKSRVAIRRFTLDGADFVNTYGAVVTRTYNYLKTLPEFTGAVDV